MLPPHHNHQWGVQRGPGWWGLNRDAVRDRDIRSSVWQLCPRWINTYYWPDRTIPVGRSEQPYGRGRHIFEYFPLLPGGPPGILSDEKLLSLVGFSAQIFNNSLDTRYRISRADFRKE